MALDLLSKEDLALEDEDLFVIFSRFDYQYGSGSHCYLLVWFVSLEMYISF